MPNCFTLTRKGENEPASLEAIEEAVCNYLGVEMHPKKYVKGWFDSIGLALAYGKDWAWIKNTFNDDVALMKIALYLEANYTADAWSLIRGKR